MPLRILLIFLFSLSAKAQNIVIKGSDTLGAKMVPQLAEHYKKEHPDLQFEIAAEGSSTCFTNIAANTCDFGMASRSIKEEEKKNIQEKGIKLIEHVVAYDIIGIVVDEENPIDNLTRKQIKDIFTSKTTDWKDLGWDAGGTINVLTRNTSSGTYKTFQKLAMDKEPYGATTQKIAGNEAIQTLAALKTTNGISYCGLAYVNKDGLKALQIDGVDPAARNALSYPFSRNLYFYSTDKTSEAASAFIEWVKTSKDAARVIEKVGFVSASLTQKSSN
jgi:phosphate transport system substrate-binding protein